MNRPATALFAALESLLVVGIGVGIPVVALTFLWAFQYGLQIDWLVFWRAGADIWLLGHGVDLTLTLSKSAAAATGISGAGAPILLSIAALGFGVTTALLGARTGRRIAETRHRAIGTVSAILAFALVAALVVASARQPLAEPAPVQGVLLPTLLFALPLIGAAEVNRRRRGAEPDPVTGLILRGIELIPSVGRAVVAIAVRAALGVSAIVFAVAGLAVAILLLTHYASMITLYEGAHAGGLGGLALTLGQAALIPNAVAWAASWFVGPGFALGSGSSISPLGTVIGPMPALPLLGALPTKELSFGFVGILVPVVATFVVVTLLRPSIERRLGGDDSLVVRIISGAAIGVVAGLVIGFVTGFSAGSAGPGRLVDVGPDGLVVGAFAALEVALPAILALVVKQPDVALSDVTSAVSGRLPARGGSMPGDAKADGPKKTDSAPVASSSSPSTSATATPTADPGHRLTDVLPSLDEAVDGRGSAPTDLRRKNREARFSPNREDVPGAAREADSGAASGPDSDAVETEKLDGFTR